jgi:hypothetical protein
MVTSIIHLPSITAVPGTPSHNSADELLQNRGRLCMDVMRALGVDLRVVGFGPVVRGTGKNGDYISVLSPKLSWR